MDKKTIIICICAAVILLGILAFAIYRGSVVNVSSQ